MCAAVLPWALSAGHHSLANATATNKNEMMEFGMILAWLERQIAEYLHFQQFMHCTSHMQDQYNRVLCVGRL